MHLDVDAFLPATDEEKIMMDIDPKKEVLIHEPVGCVQCDNMGYKGRIGVYEIMDVSPEVKRVIAKGGEAEEIKNAALMSGMRTLRMCATDYVLQGITTVSEMIKVSFDT